LQAIGGIGGSGTATATRRRSDAPAEPPMPLPGRALVAAAAPVASENTTLSSRRPHAAFLAHLIATGQQAPQTRARRRAEPAEAITLYVDQMTQAPAAAGRIVARTT
jgi:hypothetical protein